MAHPNGPLNRLPRNIRAEMWLIDHLIARTPLEERVTAWMETNMRHLLRTAAVLALLGVVWLTAPLAGQVAATIQL
jgi:hypothetical protein